MDTVWAFFTKSGDFFSIFKVGQGRPPHLPSPALLYKFAVILFLSFLTNQKEESGFQQVGGVVTKNISVFSHG